MDTSERQIKRIVLNRMERCGTCHHNFDPEEIHVLSRRPDMWMMVVECSECHSRNFVAAVLNDGDPGEAQIALRRLSGDNAPLEAPVPEAIAPPVTTDDVLDVHRFLDSFDGDFRQLFKER